MKSSGASAPTAAPESPAGGGSLRVALGILSSRLSGLVRESVVAGVLGVGPHADVLAAVFRAPNLLQSLLGEQALSASFIPVYSRLLAKGRPEVAGAFAGAVFGLLLAAAATITGLGVVFAPQFVTVFAPGFVGDAARVAAGEAQVDRFALAVSAVRWTLPMAGVLVLSSWSLGVLNSHRRFFLSYFAPVVWNLSIIAALTAAAYGLIGDGRPRRDGLLLAACAGALLGAVLQFAVQLPRVGGLLRGFRLSFSTRVEGVREALSRFAPVVAARGATQLSVYLDQVLASLLAAGALAGIRWATILYMLPISLFALSVAAAELPEMARHGPGDSAAIVRRARAGLRQMGFLVLPTTVGYLAFGFLIVGGIYRWGQFTGQHNWLVFLILAGYTAGLPAAAASRLLVNTFYALGETAVPARIAVIRIVLTPAIGVPAMLLLDQIPVVSIGGGPAGDSPLFLGAVGLALGGAVSSWLELGLLRRALGSRLPGFTLPVAAAAGNIVRAAAAALPLFLLAPRTAGLPLPVRAVVVVLGYAALYFLLSRRARRQEIEAWLGRFAGRGRR